MKINSLKKIVAVGISVSTCGFIAIPVFAATPIKPFVMSSTTRPQMVSSTTRIVNQQNKGQMEAMKRIQSIQMLIVRIQNMKNLSNADKASIKADLTTELTNLNSTRNRIGSGNSTTTLGADKDSLIGGSRIYALVIPKTTILAAADRAQTLIGMMNTLGTKLEARIASSNGVSVASSTQAVLVDFKAKVADAAVQVKAAIDEVTPLVPDNGDKTKFAANLAALKDARTKIQAAQADLVAARKDAETIKQALKKK